MVGTTEQLATEVEAREIVEGIVLEINFDDPRLLTSVLTISQLIEHYCRRELSVDNTWKSYATKMSYENYLKRWIAPSWGTYPLSRIKPIEVELWLHQLPLARAGADIKVQQDLLRHSSARITLDTYTRAVRPAEREAQNAVVQLLFSGEARACAAVKKWSVSVEKREQLQLSAPMRVSPYVP